MTGWNAEAKQLYQEFQKSGDSDELLNRLDTERLKKLEETTDSLNFKSFSRRPEAFWRS